MTDISNIRKETEAMEHIILSKYAAFADQSLGRQIEENDDDQRTLFQRDRDRIIHCKAFRRLKHKTQVFLSPAGDHYRTRLTHTLEVSQIARSIARALRLNEDLTEAIALGHDLGHTPFGHAGERTLDKISSIGFDHCSNSLRVVEVLEKDGLGLNLTEEVRDGIINHRTSGKAKTLEGQIVRLSDKIAYINHDIDDGIRGGIITESDIPASYTDILGHSSRDRLNTLITAVIKANIGKSEITLSNEISEAVFGLRKVMFDILYSNPKAKGEEVKVSKMIEILFNYFMEEPEEVPQVYRNIVNERGESHEQAVCDYISGMSDDFCVRTFENIFIPKNWQQ